MVVIKKLISNLVIFELRVFVGKFLYLILIDNGDDGNGIMKSEVNLKGKGFIGWVINLS